MYKRSVNCISQISLTCNLSLSCQGASKIFLLVTICGTSGERKKTVGKEEIFLVFYQGKGKIKEVITLKKENIRERNLGE